MIQSIFSLKLSQLELAVRLGQLTPQQAIEAACETARQLGLSQEVIDRLKGQPPVIKGGE